MPIDTTILGGVKITGAVTPTSANDVFASHRAWFGRGGYRSVDDIAQRDTIPTDRREQGMWVKTMADQKVWELAADLTTWTEVTFGSPNALLKTNNLSDVSNVATSRTNLGLGNSATRNVGTSAGTVAAGDDSRLTNSRTPTAHATTHVTGGTDKIRDATAAQDGLMTAAYATKLDGIQAGAQANLVTSVAGRTGAVVVTKTDVGLPNVTNDAQLKIASNLSDVANVATARSNLGLGTAAQMASSAFATAAQGTAADLAYNNAIVQITNSAATDTTAKVGHVYKIDASGYLTALTALYDQAIAIVTVGAVANAASTCRLVYSGDVTQLYLASGSGVKTGDCLYLNYSGVNAGKVTKATAGSPIFGVAAEAATGPTLVKSVIVGGSQVYPIVPATSYTVWYGRTQNPILDNADISVASTYSLSVSKTSCAGSFTVPALPAAPDPASDKIYVYLALPMIVSGTTLAPSSWAPASIKSGGFDVVLTAVSPFTFTINNLPHQQYVLGNTTWRLFRSLNGLGGQTKIDVAL